MSCTVFRCAIRTHWRMEFLSPHSRGRSSTGGYTEVTAQRRVYVRSGEKQITGKETETGKPGEGNRQEERHWDFTVTSFTPAPSNSATEMKIFLRAAPAFYVFSTPSFPTKLFFAQVGGFLFLLWFALRCCVDAHARCTNPGQREAFTALMAEASALSNMAPSLSAPPSSSHSSQSQTSSTGRVHSGATTAGGYARLPAGATELVDVELGNQ